MKPRDLALHYAQQRGIPGDMFLRLIQQESGWDQNAVSPAGAIGPAQIMPATARDPGYGIAPVTDPRDWDQSLGFAAQYLSALNKENDGDWTKTLAAYNWGQGNVEKKGLGAAPAETRNYIATILGPDAAPLSSAAYGPMSMAGEQGNSPVTADTLMSQEQREIENPRAFKGWGNALSSLGAAMSASAQGISAADALGDISQRYFDQQEAQYAKMEKDRQRAALLSMVGENTPMGQALLNGADPQQVMQAWSQERGFANDRALADMGHQQAIERGAIDHSYRIDERTLQSGFDAAAEERRNSWQSSENALDREQRQAALDQEVKQFNINATQMGDAGAAAKVFMANQAEKVGDTELAKSIRNMPATAFSDPAMIGQLSEYLKADDPITATDKMRDFAFLVGQGVSSTDALDRVFRSGVNVQVGGEGAGLAGFGGLSKAPAGMDFVRNPDGSPVIDPETNSPILHHMKGTPEFEDRAAAAASAAAAAESRKSSELQKSNNVLSAIGQARENNTNWATGLYGQVASNFWGTDASDLAASLSTVGANIAFDRLTKMREESPTGGALGSITEGELRLLQDSVAALAQSQGRRQIDENLDKVEQQYLKIVKKAEGIPDEVQRQAVLEALGVGAGGLDPNADVSDDDLVNKWAE